MGVPGNAIIDRLRTRLCRRLVREVDEADMTFLDDGARIRWVVLGLFDRQWLERFFPGNGPPARDEALLPVREPHGRIRGKTLRGWWEFLTPQVLAWGRHQPWAHCGDGVDGLLGEAYVVAANLWPLSNGLFPLPPTPPNAPVTQWTDCPIAWMTAILCRVAAHPKNTKEVTLAFDPAGRPERAIDDGTMTRLSDRQVMAQRVVHLSSVLPTAVPRLEDRLGGRGTLQLVLVADQLEIALALPDHYRLQWCLQTLAGQVPEVIAQEMHTTPENIQTRFCRIQHCAQSNLADLWCQYL